MQDDFRNDYRIDFAEKKGSNLNDAFPLIHCTAAGAFGEVPLREIFEDMIAYPTDHEVLTTTVLTPLSENFGREPCEEKGAKNYDQIHGDHSI